MKKELELKIEEWKEVKGLTYDFINSLTNEQLGLTVGKNMGTLGKQFRHMGDVQFCYNSGIETGKIDFDKYRRDYSLENSKEKLIGFLKEQDEDLISFVEKNEDKKIDWGFEKMSLEKHLNFLIQHEIFHHGEWVVYIRSLDLKLPDSWKENYGL